LTGIQFAVLYDDAMLSSLRWRNSSAFMEIWYGKISSRNNETNAEDTILNFFPQEKRLAQEIADLERETGFKLRILVQNYPDTPGIKSCLSTLLLS